MSLHVYDDLEQGTEAWLAARRGIVTASVVGSLVSVGPAPAASAACPSCGAEPWAPCISRARKEPTPMQTTHPARVAADDAPLVIEPAFGDTARGLTLTLAAERITGWTEPVFVNTDMMRGTLDEPIARDLYRDHYAPVDEVGFMVLDHGKWRLGYSPDGLVGDDGLIEIKSRRQKAQLATVLADEVPAANMAQIQAGLLVSGREWCDYVSYCGGMRLYVKRVYPDERWFTAITAAVTTFEQSVAEMVATYTARTAGSPMTERVDHFAEIEV